MQTIQIDTRIAAPVERCFLLSLSMDLHVEEQFADERAIAGVTTGLIGAGETVTFEARHFGIPLHHTSLISGYETPTYFQDSMIRAIFKSFVHDHYLEAEDGGTLMRDELQFTAPLGILGTIAEVVVLRRYLAGFLMERNALIQRVAASEEWRRFIPKGAI